MYVFGETDPNVQTLKINLYKYNENTSEIQEVSWMGNNIIPVMKKNDLPLIKYVQFVPGSIRSQRLS